MYSPVTLRSGSEKLSKIPTGMEVKEKEVLMKKETILLLAYIVGSSAVLIGAGIAVNSFSKENTLFFGDPAILELLKVLKLPLQVLFIVFPVLYLLSSLLFLFKRGRFSLLVLSDYIALFSFPVWVFSTLSLVFLEASSSTLLVPILISMGGSFILVIAGPIGHVIETEKLESVSIFQ